MNILASLFFRRDPIGTALTNLPAGITLMAERCGCMFHDGCRVVACKEHPPTEAEKPK